MTKVKKLEVSCLKIVMDLGLIINSEIVPDPLVKKIREIRSINGKYYSQDNRDIISFFNLNYDGETIDIYFEKNRIIHQVSCDNNLEIPLNREILYFIDLQQNPKMGVNILLKENGAIVELMSGDSQWKWKLSLEIR